MPREWVSKFESGEYLREWRGYEPFFITGFYFDHIGGEKEFSHCVGMFSGIGDVEWWISAELDKLTDDQKIRLESILRRDKTFRDQIKTHDRIKALTDYFGLTDTCFIYRLGDDKLFNIFKTLNDVYNEAIQKDGSINQFDHSRKPLPLAPRLYYDKDIEVDSYVQEKEKKVEYEYFDDFRSKRMKLPESIAKSCEIKFGDGMVPDKEELLSFLGDSIKIS